LCGLPQGRRQHHQCKEAGNRLTNASQEADLQELPVETDWLDAAGSSYSE
jgi:hypothetical protein